MCKGNFPDLETASSVIQDCGPLAIEQFNNKGRTNRNAEEKGYIGWESNDVISSALRSDDIGVGRIVLNSWTPDGVPSGDS